MTGAAPSCDGSPTTLSIRDWDLVGAGDIADCMGGAHRTASLLDALPGTVITMGDNAYPDGSMSDYLSCYHPTWGRHLARTRPTPGNHDYDTPGAAPYFTYFGESAGPPGRGYYSFDLAGWHIVAYNSAADIGPASDQVEWLREDLHAASSRCVLAYGYHPRFSSGWHGDNDIVSAIWSVFYEFGVDVVLSGHDHHYERFAPLNEARQIDRDRGIRQFVVGTGGRGLRDIEKVTGWSEFHLGASPGNRGVIAFDLEPGRYSWEFITTNGGRVADVGSDVCR